MPFVDVVESVGGGSVAEVAVRRMPWSMSSRVLGNVVISKKIPTHTQDHGDA